MTIQLDENGHPIANVSGEGSGGSGYTGYQRNEDAPAPQADPERLSPVITARNPVFVDRNPETESRVDEPVRPGASRVPTPAPATGLTREEIVQQRRQTAERAAQREQLIERVTKNMPAVPVEEARHQGASREPGNETDRTRTGVGAPSVNKGAIPTELPGVAWERAYDSIQQLVADGKVGDALKKAELLARSLSGNEQNEVAAIVQEIRTMRPDLIAAETATGFEPLPESRVVAARFTGDPTNSFAKLDENVVPASKEVTPQAVTPFVAAPLYVAAARGAKEASEIASSGTGMPTPAIPTESAAAIDGRSRAKSLQGLLAALKNGTTPTLTAGRPLRQLASASAMARPLPVEASPTLSLARFVNLPWASTTSPFQFMWLWGANLGWALLGLLLLYRTARLFRRSSVSSALVTVTAAEAVAVPIAEVAASAPAPKAEQKIAGKSWLKRERRRAVPNDDTNTRAMSPDLTNPMASATRTIANFEMKRKEDFVAIASEKTAILKSE